MSEVINWLKTPPDNKVWYTVYFTGGHGSDDFKADRWQQMVTKGPIRFNAKWEGEVTDYLIRITTEKHANYAPFEWGPSLPLKLEGEEMIGLIDNEGDYWWLILRRDESEDEGLEYFKEWARLAQSD